jgi:tRNA(fMet)-specific endonuclease VapC
MNKLLMCDTCTIIDFINGNPNLLSQLIQDHFILFINFIIEMELLQGAHNKKELRKIEQKLNFFRRLDITQDILDTATHMVRKYSLSHQLKLADAIIAATAVTYDMPLYTYNVSDFKYLPDILLWDSSKYISQDDKKNLA